MREPEATEAAAWRGLKNSQWASQLRLGVSRAFGVAARRAVRGIADRAMYEAKTQRNACVGFRATATTGRNERLYQAIQQDPQALAREGAIEVRQLVPATSSEERRA